MPFICCADQGCLENSGNGKHFKRVSQRKQLSSVSTALLLALGLGIFEALAMYLGSGTFLRIIGVSMVCFHSNTVFPDHWHLCLLYLVRCRILSIVNLVVIRSLWHVSCLWIVISFLNNSFSTGKSDICSGTKISLFKSDRCPWSCAFFGSSRHFPWL